jgi:hypothetical protein
MKCQSVSLLYLAPAVATKQYPDLGDLTAQFVSNTFQ